jgi:hypothetical protein
MSLLNTYVMTYGQTGKFLDAIREGQAPEKFTRQYLKDLGFKSSNHHAFIPLLKGLGFLTPDGTPTQRYKDYLDKSRSQRILGEAMREAYSDIFTIRSNPKKEDKGVIEGKFRSTYNSSANTADLCAKTFLALLDHADLSGETSNVKEHKSKEKDNTQKAKSNEGEHDPDKKKEQGGVGLHYNIQIHLPPSKDIEVYNAIFKSLKDHLLG